MTKAEMIGFLAASPEAELGDNLIELAVAYWLEQGFSKEDVLFCVQEVLDESGGLEDTG